MKQITLTILAEDILLNNYMDARHCPITKALNIAGYNNLKDIGHITGYDNDGTGNVIKIGNDNETYLELVTKLFGMYNSMGNGCSIHEKREIPAIPVETFIHTLEY